MATRTREQLREDYGLVVLEDISDLKGENPERRIVRDEMHSDILGVPKGAVLAHLPENPDRRQTCTIRMEGGGSLSWIMRAEGPLWQADLFIEADECPWGEPIYEYLDKLQCLFPTMKRAVEDAEPWPQKHETMEATVKGIFSETITPEQRERMNPPRNLYQRYG